ncbi:hypothetical protein [Evansella clarkii]|uniref:hypothetical protein n=1 Tax=Evansella clarkii TaxID=79879 RepID=UPI0009982FF6|nr:hypothetical protein [Evansella clarkii]
MSISLRHIKIENVECLVHLPARPNGFGVLILGDRNHYVEGGISFWQQHTARKQLLQSLVNEGYTVFYSGIGEMHWGSDKYMALTDRLIRHVLKNEILNRKIHILAEGMGALLAVRLMVRSPDSLRSVTLFNPCLDLDKHLSEEKINRFFYKRFVKELVNAYCVKEEEVKEICEKRTREMSEIPFHIPLRIFQLIYQAPYSPDVHVRPFIKERNDKQKDLATTFYMPGKTIEQFTKQLLIFLKKYETTSIKLGSVREEG